MSRHQYTVFVFGIELTHEQATKIYENEMANHPELATPLEMLTHNDNFYRNVCPYYDQNPSISHYLVIRIDEHRQNELYTEINKEFGYIFKEVSESILKKYHIEQLAHTYLITQVF